MITKMTKYTFLITNKEYDSFISAIREIGVVHVDQLQQGATSQEFERAKLLNERFENAIKTLDYAKETYTTDNEYKPIQFDERTAAQTDRIFVDAQNILTKIEELSTKELAINHELDETNKAISIVEPWGNFNSDNLSFLHESGYNVGFWTCPSKMFRTEWIDKFFATEINEFNKKIFFLTFTKEQPDIAAESVVLPKLNLEELTSQKFSLEQQLKKIQEEFLRINKEERSILMAGKTQNENELSLSKVHLSGEALIDNHLKLMVGWAPNEKSEELNTYLNDNKIFFEKEDPKEDDTVPVEIKNDKYSSLFEPILKMYSLPNYKDLDITPFFAPFFMLFFGLCLGDAGYGLIVLVASIILFFKSSDNIKPYAKLGIYLGATTIVCGLLTGTFLGIDLSQQEWAFLSPVKKLFVNENNYKLFGYSPMMVISVFIGLVQVLLGMVLAGIKAAKLNGWKFAVGKISWVLAIIMAIIAFGLPACGVSLPQPLLYVLYGIIALSVIGIFFCNSPDKNIFMNFGTGLWDTYGMATGLLGDLLSYIRLFALGLTGGVLGSVFNQLAIQMTDGMSWFIRWLPMLLILLFGHGINFALCMISSFVHPMRLTFVEFFKNADFEGGGKAYDPFRVKEYEKTE